MITEDRLKEIEECLKASGVEKWRFESWKEELLGDGHEEPLYRHVHIRELDELGDTGIQHTNDYTPWQVWEFIIRSHDEFVPELVAEVRRLRKIISDVIQLEITKVEKALKEGPFNQ